MSELELLLCADAVLWSKRCSIFMFTRSIRVMGYQSDQLKLTEGLTSVYCIARAAQRGRMVTDRFCLVRSLIASVVLFRAGGLFNGTAVLGES